MTLSIPGLRYVPFYLSAEAHDQLLSELDSEPWHALDWNPREGRRRVQCYGYRYDFEKGTAEWLGELPNWAMNTAVRLREDGLMPYLADQIIVNEYEAGRGIAWHVDAPVFADTIVGLSLGSTCVMEFRHQHSGDEQHLLVEPRSAVVLSGEARSSWRHSIPGRHTDRWMNRDIPRARRVSLTFRKIVAGRDG